MMKNFFQRTPLKPQTDASFNDICFDAVLDDYEEFVKIVSQDFDAPLHHIEEFSKLLMSSMENIRPDQQVCMDYINKSLLRLKKMQNALGTIAKIKTENRPKETIDMQELLKKIIQNIDFSNYATTPVINCKPLPPIKAIPEIIEDFFLHVLDNACRYGSPNGKQKISIRSFEKKDEFIFEIRDNGIGIDSDFCDVVFNIFKRLHPQGKYGDGVGAGLTISKKIIEHHGGQIWIQSKLDKGTSVLFSLPNK